MNNLEKRVYKTLVAEGYLVEKPVKTKWHRVDLFNCWDFIACDNQRIRFIQVSAKYFTDRSKESQDAMLNFPCPSNCTKEYWQYRGQKKGIRIIPIDEELKNHITIIRNSKKK